jgi:hypothetical protein
MNIDLCRSCGAPIVWTVTRKGKRMPVDAEPVSNGKFVLENEEDNEKRLAVFIGEGDYRGPRYSSHFGTCPHAAEHSGHPRGETSDKESPCRPDGEGFCATHPPCEMMRVLVDSLRRQLEK